MKKSPQGFTLLELLVTVAIVGILAAIAYPSYRNQVMRSNRSEARSALLRVQVAQEKFFLQNNRYAGGTSASASVTELTNAPTHTTTSGLGVSTLTPNSHYTITLVTPSAITYTATATATGGQTNDTDCLTWTINQAGTRTATTDNCWR